MTTIEFYDKIYKKISDYSDEYVKDETPRTLGFTRESFRTYAKTACEEVVAESQVNHKAYETLVEISTELVEPQVFSIWLTIGVYALRIRIKLNFKEKTATLTRINI